MNSSKTAETATTSFPSLGLRRRLLTPAVVERARGAAFSILDTEGGEPVGCGFFLAPRVAVTALHNLAKEVDKEPSVYVPDVRLYPACFRL